MKRFVRIIILTALILAGVLAGYQGIRNSSVSMDSLLGISAAGDGSTVTGWYDGLTVPCWRVSVRMDLSMELFSSRR